MGPAVAPRLETAREEKEDEIGTANGPLAQGHAGLVNTLPHASPGQVRLASGSEQAKPICNQ